MKTLISTTFRACLLLLAAACIQTAAVAQELTLNLSQMTKYLDGAQTSEDLSNRLDITNVGIVDAASAHYFTSDASFEAWAQSQTNGAAIVARNRALNNISSFAIRNGYENLEEGAPLPSDLQAFINSQIPGSIDNYQRAIAGPLAFVTFYDYPQFTGSSKTCVGPFSWKINNFQNKAESAKGAGLLTLFTFCDKKWFGGQKYHVFSPALFSVINFGSMNNRIESYFTN